MASGKKNYFRHSANARNDEFVIELINTFKEKGYFMWFALIELSVELIGDGNAQPLRFNRSRLTRELRSTQKTLSEFLLFCESRSKVLITYPEPTSEVPSTYLQGTSNLPSRYLQPTFNLEIPSLLKFVGKYSEKVPNEIKRKEIKENKKKEGENVISSNLFEESKLADFSERSFPQECSTVLTMLNALCFKNFRPSKETFLLINGLLKAGHKLEDFKAVIQTKQNEWGDHPVYAENLRPSTLFGNKFKTYLDHSRYAASKAQNKGKVAFKSRGHGVEPTEKNPTGNPYIQEAIEKGMIA